MNPNRFKQAELLLNAALYKEAYTMDSNRPAPNPVKPAFRPRPVTGFRPVGPSTPPPSPVATAPSNRNVPYGYARNSSGDLVSRPAIGLATAYEDPIGANNIAYSRNAKAYGAPTPVPRSAVRKPVTKPAPRPVARPVAPPVAKPVPTPKPVARSIAPPAPAKGYTPVWSEPPKPIKNPDGSSSFSFTVPGMRFGKSYYDGPTRSAADIRKANKEFSDKFRSPDLTWDKDTGKYNWTGAKGRVAPYHASQVELARLRNIWNNMNEQEQKKYTDIFNKRVQALRAYNPFSL